MTRRHVAFECEGSRLAGTLDEGGARSALLIVTGGNEVRAGAWGGQSWLAARLSGEGYPVFRFDRRGTGDSEGANGEFRSSAADIAAALSTLRRECPDVRRVVGFGNCDAASALMLAEGAGCDALVLSNPWTIEQDDAAPSPEALRDHYKRRLADPAAVKRLFTGKVSPRRLAGSLLGALRPPPPPTSLAEAMKSGIARYQGNVRFLVAERDRTAQAFLSTWDRSDPRIERCPDATHSYVEPHAREWLVQRLLGALAT